MMFDHSCNNSSSWTFRVFLLALAAVAVHASTGSSERLKWAEAQNQLEQCHELHEKELNRVQKLLEVAATSCGRGLWEDVSADLRALTPVPTPTGNYENLSERDLRLKLRGYALDMLEQTLLSKIQNLVPCDKCTMYEDLETSCPICERIFEILKKMPDRPLPAGWREITPKSGEVYYTNRIGDDKALASGFFEKPIGQDRSEKPRAIPEYYAQAEDLVEDLMEKIWTERRAAGRQCQKCLRIFTDQEMRWHIQAATPPFNLTDQELDDIIKEGGAKLRECRRCDLFFPFY